MRQGSDPFAAIETVLPWHAFAARVMDAAQLAAASEADFLGLVGEYYGQLRRYGPALLKTFEFGAAVLPNKAEIGPTERVMPDPFGLIHRDCEQRLALGRCQQFTARHGLPRRSTAA
jgi:hypothetical protein